MLNWFSRQGKKCPPRLPAAPEGLTIYAVGDIHGRSDLLSELHKRIDVDAARNPARQTIEIYLGDYVDRGPDSAGVIDQLVARSTMRDAIFIRGNHEALLSDFIDGKVTIDKWKPLGGVETMLSYGVSNTELGNELAGHSVLERFRALLPSAHHMFLRALRPYFQVGDYLFVHAGIKPRVDLDKQSEQTMMWIRDEFLSYRGKFQYIVVHGHTPVLEPEMHSNRINIDSGAFATNKLTCLRIDENGPTFFEAR